MRILIVEDDHFQIEDMEMALTDAFPGVELVTMSSEHEFRVRFGELAQLPPDTALLDVMMRWTDPGSGMVTAPPDVLEDNGYAHAGLRCRRMLANNGSTADTPVVLYSVLEKRDLDLTGFANTSFLRKETSFTPLLEDIRRLTT